MGRSCQGSDLAPPPTSVNLGLDGPALQAKRRVNGSSRGRDRESPGSGPWERGAGARESGGVERNGGELLEDDAPREGVLDRPPEKIGILPPRLLHVIGEILGKLNDQLDRTRV